VFRPKNKYLSGILLSFVVAMAQAQPDDGFHQYFHPNGKVSSEGYLVNGQPEGYWKAYYDTGVIRSEGNRLRHQLDSVWRFYDPKGRLMQEITYSEDERNGPMRRFAADGGLLSEEHFLNDKREGEAHYYHDDGSLHKLIPFKDGVEDGKGYEYADDGRIITIFHYGAGMLRRREEINRTDANGLRQGTWKEFHPNGRLHSEGNYVDDRRNGIFKIYDREGNLKDLVKYDLGEVAPEEEQAMMLDIRRTYHPNGKVATLGSYSRTGTREGLFREYDDKGNLTAAIIYTGNRVVSRGMVDERGQMTGIWNEYYVSGEKRAEGEYVEGRKHGSWVFYHRTGEVEQRGNYVNGLPHGNWRWYYRSGKLHREETYRRGREDGESVEYDEQGNILVKGEYIDGLREGEWSYHVGDHREQGSYRSGLKHGEWVHIYDHSGKRHFVGEFIDGERHGRHRWWWPNGQLRLDGRWRMGQEQGDHIHYDELGNVDLVLRYKDGSVQRIGGQRVPQVDTP